MEPLSTLNSGASLAQQSKSIQLKALAAKARELAGASSGLEVFKLNDTQPLSMGPKVSTAQKNKDDELMEVARKFEGILIHQMLKEMRKTVHKSDLMNSFSLQQYESMMDEEIANEMAKRKGIGLADSLYNQLSRMEKAAHPPTNISNAILEDQPK
jgi:flagellar protein FlgJ